MYSDRKGSEGEENPITNDCGERSGTFARHSAACSPTQNQIEPSAEERRRRTKCRTHMFRSASAHKVETILCVYLDHSLFALLEGLRRARPRAGEPHRSRLLPAARRRTCESAPKRKRKIESHRAAFGSIWPFLCGEHMHASVRAFISAANQPNDTAASAASVGTHM